MIPGGNTFINLDLAYRIELAHAWRKIQYARAYHLLHPESGSQVESVAGGFVIYAGPGSVVNCASALGLDGEVQVEDFERLEEFFYRQGEPLKLEASPLAHPSLFDLAARRSYTLHGFHSVLVRFLEDGLQPTPPPPGITISRAVPYQSQLWIHTSAQGFDGTDQPSPEVYDILAPNFFSENSACYFAWAGGSEAVGSAGMYLHGGVVELGGASTRLTYRRQGIHHALLETRLSHASALGCDLAIILTEPGSDSQRSAQRSGFNLAYTQVHLHKSP